MKRSFFVISLFMTLYVNGNNLLVPRTDTVYINKSKNHYYINSYFNNGNLASQAYYSENFKYKYVLYNEKGQKVELAYLNKYSNRIDYKVEYYFTGVPKNIFYCFGEYFVTDTAKETGEINNFLKLDGHWIIYHENGNKKEEFTIINSKLNGEYREYYNNGVIKLNEFYYNGVKTGMCFFYDEKSNLVKTDTLFISH